MKVRNTADTTKASSKPASRPTNLKPVWAIDIGTSALRALHCIPSNDNERMMADDFFYLDYRTLPESERIRPIKEALRKFGVNHRFAGNAFAVSLPTQGIPGTHSRVYENLENHLGTLHPSLKQETVDNAYALKSVGIKPKMFQLKSSALCNFVLFDQPPQGNLLESVAIVYIGSEESRLVITDGIHIWSCNFDFGGVQFSKKLATELKLNPSQAEHLKRNATSSRDPVAVFQAMKPAFEQVVFDLATHLSLFNNLVPSARIGRVILAGNTFKLPGLCRYIGSKLNIDQDQQPEVVPLKTFSKLDGPEVINNPTFQEDLSSFAVCYGLAIHAMGHAKLYANLRLRP